MDDVHKHLPGKHDQSEHARIQHRSERLPEKLVASRTNSKSKTTNVNMNEFAPWSRGLGLRLAQDTRNLNLAAHMLDNPEWIKKNPVVVTVYSDGAKIDDGAHRFVAARLIGLKEIPMKIRVSDAQMPKTSGVEALHAEHWRKKMVNAKPVPKKQIRRKEVNPVAEKINSALTASGEKKARISKNAEHWVSARKVNLRVSTTPPAYSDIQRLKYEGWPKFSHDFDPITDDVWATQPRINLTKSAQMKKITTPVVVLRINGRYLLIDGHHRWASAWQRSTWVPAVVYDADLQIQKHLDGKHDQNDHRRGATVAAGGAAVARSASKRAKDSSDANLMRRMGNSDLADSMTGKRKVRRKRLANLLALVGLNHAKEFKEHHDVSKHMIGQHNQAEHVADRLRHKKKGIKSAQEGKKAWDNRNNVGIRQYKPQKKRLRDELEFKP